MSGNSGLGGSALPGRRAGLLLAAGLFAASVLSARDGVELIGHTNVRGQRAGRSSILFVIGEPEYRTAETLPEFARTELVPLGFPVKIVQADERDPNNFPGLTEAARTADLILISIRRRTPPQVQLDALRAHLAAGKPLAGIRTASHAFVPRDNEARAAGGATWPDFDPSVLGGHYTGHWGVGPKVSLALAPGASGHPVLAGIDPHRMAGNGSLYRVAPLEPSAIPLIIGTVPGRPPEPVAWTNTPPAGKSRVFYTSLGHPDDFKDPVFRKLLLNGLCWALGIDPPGALEVPARNGRKHRPF